MSKLIEEWRPIQEYEGLYEVSDWGRVKSAKKILKPHQNKKGYFLVGLYKNAKMTMKRIHRLVAENFIPNPQNLPQVNHKDEDKANNCVENLEWCSNEYNSNYGTRLYRIHKSNLNNPKLSKTVYQYTLDGKLVAIWVSASEAARQLGYSQSCITDCCNNKRKTHKGFKWSYEPLN